MSLRGLCEALARAGVRCAIGGDRSTLSLAPRSALAPDLVAAVRYWKPELVRAARLAEGPFTPIPCAHCASEVVLAAGERCPWCAVVIGRCVLYPAGGPLEIALLNALAGVPGVPRSVGSTGHGTPAGHFVRQD